MSFQNDDVLKSFVGNSANQFSHFVGTKVFDVIIGLSWTSPAMPSQHHYHYHHHRHDPSGCLVQLTSYIVSLSPLFVQHESSFVDIYIFIRESHLPPPPESLLDVRHGPHTARIVGCTKQPTVNQKSSQRQTSKGFIDVSPIYFIIASH